MVREDEHHDKGDPDREDPNGDPRSAGPGRSSSRPGTSTRPGPLRRSVRLGDGTVPPVPQPAPFSPTAVGTRGHPPVYSPFGGAGLPGQRSRPLAGGVARSGAQQPGFGRNRIPLNQALQTRPLDRGASANPLIAAAAPLLMLLGRLRSGLIDMQPAPLLDHFSRELDRFERNALLLGATPHEAMVGKYQLAGTADDIMQNLPGAADAGDMQYSLVARYFRRRDASIGFFQELEKALQYPVANADLLELGLTCLSLGFEGKYRDSAEGATELVRLRRSIHTALRAARPRPAGPLSISWAPVTAGTGQGPGIPIATALGVAATLLVLTFALLASILDRQGASVARTLAGLSPQVPIELARAPGEVYLADFPQLDRVAEALDARFADDPVAMSRMGDYIALEMRQRLFPEGDDRLADGISDQLAGIAAVLAAEPGPILIKGFAADSEVSWRSRYRSPDALALARAERIRETLTAELADPARMEVAAGTLSDIAGPAETEARQIVILLRREGTY